MPFNAGTLPQTHTMTSRSSCPDLTLFCFNTPLLAPLVYVVSSSLLVVSFRPRCSGGSPSQKSTLARSGLAFALKRTTLLVQYLINKLSNRRAVLCVAPGPGGSSNT